LLPVWCSREAPDTALTEGRIAVLKGA